MPNACFVNASKGKPRQFVLLDRDGTINKECHYLSDPDQISLIPGAGEGLHQLLTL